jgi:hypothetical protein
MHTNKRTQEMSDPMLEVSRQACEKWTMRYSFAALRAALRVTACFACYLNLAAVEEGLCLLEPGRKLRLRVMSRHLRMSFHSRSIMR